jgi:uncharacterized membrane protein YfcA
MIDITFQLIILLVLVAFFAGFVDAIAGGGGLITMPALLFTGLPTVNAIATVRAQAFFGTASAAYTFHKAGKIEWRELRLPLVFAIIGAFCGGLALQVANTDFLRKIVPYILLAVAFYFAFSPYFIKAQKKVISLSIYAFTMALPIGFYDGFFGPGAGSFYMVALVGLVGMDLMRANATTKALNAVSNLSSLLIFIYNGLVIWKIAIPMIIGQILGAYIGARVTLKNGAKIIRPVIIAVCVILAIKLMN